MNREIKDVKIVGGGDSGLLTGLFIQKFNPSLDITVVDDFAEDPPDVGKSTFSFIQFLLHEALDIPEPKFIREVKPIWKASVYFRDWCGNDPFHYTFDYPKITPGQSAENTVQEYYYLYDEVYPNVDRGTVNSEMVEQRKCPFYFNRQGSVECYDTTAYHLNTHRFNSFLRDLCEERGISLVDDGITDVETDGAYVTQVSSENASYTADLYVDASGFRRVIKDELESEFRDFGFPLDSAFNAQVELSLSEVLPATAIDTGDHGWFWQIDTFDNRDLGYVYASDFVDEDDALEDFLERCDGAVSESEVNRHEFDSGYYERAWEENCVAIGNAEGFVEPLQSTALTANGKAAIVLSKLISSHGGINYPAIREAYNSQVASIWESIYDFIALHYRFADGDNEFWDAVSAIDVSPRLETIVEAYDRHGIATDIDPIRYDDDVPNLSLFDLTSFYMVMRKMGVDSEFYEDHQFQVSDEVRESKLETIRSMKNHVEGYLTTEEFYKGVYTE